MKTTRRNTFKLLGLPVALAALPHGRASAAGGDEALHAGKVFTMTNATSGNELVVFADAPGGGLAVLTQAGTGGTGSGGGLGSQGSVTLSGNGRYVFVCNAGSDSVSTFVLRGRELQFASVVASGGQRPTSVAERDGVVVVLNVNGTGNVAGFRNEGGQLVPIAGANRPLSAPAGTAAAQVAFSADGDVLLVTERGTHRLTTYRVGNDGTLGAPIVTPSAGLVPFGFAFDQRNRVFVSEAGTGSASSYRLNGPLPQVISAAVPTTQVAPCWLLVTPNGRYVFTANTGSQSVSSFRVARSGQIQLIHAVAGSVGAGSTAVDSAIAAGGHRLFVLDRGNQRVAVFDIDPDGELTGAGSGTGLPPSVVGLAAN